MPQHGLLTWRDLLGQSFRSTAQAYDWLAGRFEQTPFRTPDAILEAAVAGIRQGGPVDIALDLGCGTGAASRAIRGLCREVLVGVDLSYGMLQVARQQWPEAGRGPRLLLCRGDALAIPTARQFDLVVSFGMFMHIEPRLLGRMVEEVARVLQPGGRFVFMTRYAPSRWSVRYWMALAFNAAMRVRNRLHAPPLILYYLGFTVPKAVRLLQEKGFEVAVRPSVAARPYRRTVLVIATRTRSR